MSNSIRRNDELAANPNASTNRSTNPLANAPWSTLIEASRHGNDQALGEVSSRFRDYLLLIASSNIGGALQSKLSASDVVQHAMLEAHRKIHTFQGSSEQELKSWLTQLVKHTLIDESRRYGKTKRRNTSLERPIDDPDAMDLGAQLVSRDESPSGVVRRRETDEALLQAMQQLSEEEQQVIKLRHRDGLSFREIGQILGLSEPKARHFWARTVEQLRNMLST